MSVYGTDPETGLFREPAQMDPLTDEQASAHRGEVTAQRYARLDGRQESQYRNLAAAIASQAQAIADGTVTGPRYASVQRLKSNVATLEAWTADDRA
jgi:hypothetical protein